MVDHIWKRGYGDPRAIHGISENWEYCIACGLKHLQDLPFDHYEWNSVDWGSSKEPPCQLSLHHLAQAYMERKAHA